MRPSPFEEATESGRHHGEAHRHAHQRAILEARVERPSVRGRLWAALVRLTPRYRHSLTDYPCRLADGSIGRVAVVLRGGEWTMVCRVA